MSTRVVAWVVTLALAWGVGAQSAQACSYGNEFLGANPPSASTLPSGSVYVALRYAFPPQSLEGFHVTNANGDDIPVSVTAVGDAVLLRFDASGADEVSVFGDLGQGGDGLLATYDVSAAAPDLSVPASPVVVLGEATCEACPEPLDSCCSRGDTEGRLTTAVTITTTQPGMILGWTNDGEHLAGVLTHTTYDSAPAYSGPRTRLPNGADIVAMSVAGVLSAPVSWELEETGPCEVVALDAGPPGERGPSGKGCAASPDASTDSTTAYVALSLLLLARLRRRPRRRPNEMSVMVVALAWFAGASSARACRTGGEFRNAIPASGSELPSGQVYVALAYSSQYPRLAGFRVENELGDELAVTFVRRGDAQLLQLDTTGSSQVTIFELNGLDESMAHAIMRATYHVSGDAPDPTMPAPPVITLGEVSCSPCPAHLQGGSCCPNFVTRLSTEVTFLAVQSDTILGWLDGDGQLVGVITHSTYESADGYSGRPTLPPEGAPIVAMSVAGVMSAPVTWAVEESGPCSLDLPDAGPPDVGLPGERGPLGKGCAASPDASTDSTTAYVALGVLVFLRRRRAPSR